MLTNKNITDGTRLHSNKTSEVINDTEFGSLLKHLEVNAVPQAANTHYREKVIDEIKLNIPDTMSHQNAVRTVRILSQMAVRSHTNTIMGWNKSHKLTYILNHCIKSISTKTGMNFATMYKRYNWSSESIFAKLVDAGFEKSILRP